MLYLLLLLFLPKIPVAFFIFTQVYSKTADQDLVLLLAARAARTENQDAIDACIVGMLSDASEVGNFVTILIKHKNSDTQNFKWKWTITGI